MAYGRSRVKEKYSPKAKRLVDQVREVLRDTPVGIGTRYSSRPGVPRSLGCLDNHDLYARHGAEPEGNRKSPGFALVRILLECPTARPRGTTIPALVNPAMAHARQLNMNFEIGLLD